MFIFLEAAAAAQPTGAMFDPMFILMIVAMFAIMYFLMIRPENKRKKKAEEMRSNLSIGDEITTIGGMTGKIVQVTEDTVTFETGEDRVRIQTKKWAIQTTAKLEAEEAAKYKRKK
jgi:preprotein translocase subunit YajC